MWGNGKVTEKDAIGSSHGLFWGTIPSLTWRYWSKHDKTKWQMTPECRIEIRVIHFVHLYYYFLTAGWDWVLWYLGHKQYTIWTLDDTWEQWSTWWHGNWERKPTWRKYGQCHFVQHITHMNWSGIQPGLVQWQAAN